MKERVHRNLSRRGYLRRISLEETEWLQGDEREAEKCGMYKGKVALGRRKPAGAHRYLRESKGFGCGVKGKTGSLG